MATKSKFKTTCAGFLALLLAGCCAISNRAEVSCAFAKLKDEGKLPGLSKGDHTRVTVSQVAGKMRNEDWFKNISKIFPDLDHLYVARVELGATELNYFFWTGGHVPKLVGTFESKDGKWNMLD